MMIFCDLETLTYLHKIRLLLNGVILNQSNENFLNADNPTFYRFNTSLSNISKSDVCLLIGVNPRTDGPLLNYYLRKRFLSGNFKVGYIGSNLNLTFPTYHLGNSVDKVVSILEGRNFFCKFLKRSKSPMIIIGKSFLNKLTLSSFNILTSILKSNFKF